MAAKTKKFLYQIILIIASVIFIIVFVRQFGQLSNAALAVSRGSWYFLFAVAGIQILGIINRGAFYNTLYDYFGVRDSLWRLMKLSLAANFVNLAAPTAGISGMAVFISEAERQGMSKSRATFVNIFAYFLIYAVFVIVLLFGLFYLLFNHQLYTYQIVTAGILFGMLLVIFIALLAIIESAARLKKLFWLIARVVNFVAKIWQRRHLIMGEEEVENLTREVNLSLKIIQKKWRHLGLPIFHVVLMEVIDLLTLYYLFLVLRYPIYPGTLITIYAIGVLFAVISLTPSGIGVVEATMIVVATGLMVPVEYAAIVVVAYRIVTFWVPFALGYFTFRGFQKEKIGQLEHGSR